MAGNGVPYTKEEDEVLLDMFNHCATLTQISRATGRSERSVETRLRWNLWDRVSFDLSAYIDDLWRCYEQSLSAKQTAIKLHISTFAIRAFYKLHGLTEPNGDSFIERLDKANAVQLVKNGVSRQELARAYHIPTNQMLRWTRMKAESGELDPAYHTRPDDKILMRLYKKGYSDAAIGKECGAHKATVARWRHEKGLPAHFQPGPGLASLTKEKKSEMLRLYNERASDRTIAETVGVSNDTVFRWRQRNGLAAKKKTAINEDNESEVLAMYQSGMSDFDIALKLGVVTATVARWRKNRGLSINKSK